MMYHLRHDNTPAAIDCLTDPSEHGEEAQELLDQTKSQLVNTPAYSRSEKVRQADATSRTHHSCTCTRPLRHIGIVKK